MTERRRGDRALAWFLGALLACACTATIGETEVPELGGPEGTGAAGGRAGSRSGAGGGTATAASPGSGEMPLRMNRLTREQYALTLRDLLGDETDVAAELPVDTAGDTGFVQPGPIGALEARRFMDLADAAASRAARNLRALMGCDVTTAEPTCLASFLPAFLKRAYRRPPSADELAAVQALHAKLRALPGQDAAGAMRALIAAIVQSPAFLYRWELGPRRAPKPSGGLIALDDYELASRLSYFITGSMPDEPLFAAADAGKLRDSVALAAQARRLLATPRARQTVRALHEQWLGTGRIRGVEKDPAVYKGFGDEVRLAMEEETRAFIDHVVFEGDGRVDTLFSASFSFVNAPLAKIYGVSGVTGTQLRKQTLNPDQRFGLMTQGSFLATHAYPHDGAPVKRGVAVREGLLCQSVPSPPRDLVVEPPEPDPAQSVRQQFVQHSTDPACNGCHGLFDPLGFAFEHYDGVGAYRATSGGKPVDASGTLTGLADGPRPFRDLRELMAAVRSSPEFKRCVTATWLRYALGRREGKGDEGPLQSLERAFEVSGGDLRELVVALVQSPSFRFRTPSIGEALP